MSLISNKNSPVSCLLGRVLYWRFCTAIMFVRSARQWWWWSRPAYRWARPAPWRRWVSSSWRWWPTSSWWPTLPLLRWCMMSRWWQRITTSTVLSIRLSVTAWRSGLWLAMTLRWLAAAPVSRWWVCTTSSSRARSLSASRWSWPRLVILTWWPWPRP